MRLTIFAGEIQTEEFTEVTISEVSRTKSEGTCDSPYSKREQTDFTIKMDSGRGESHICPCRNPFHHLNEWYRLRISKVRLTVFESDYKLKSVSNS